ncbi:hypothetical protein [Catellatospora vulcania]|uniref:hypothetical protein n=1 Tax=Catellatospora vulcania TaxID=1460450 RepID=UPI0012D43DF6|nr:hypothetical protein [Catellatospora vulcania]
MGYYGTMLLARPVGRPLPTHPEVRAFGSRVGLHGLWQQVVSLHDVGDGWQRVGVTAFHSERLRLAEGVADLLAATRAPVLAAYVAESSCALIEAGTPSGVALSLHVPNRPEDCGLEHVGGRPPVAEQQAAVDTLLAWAVEAGRTPSAQGVAEFVGMRDMPSVPMENAVVGLLTLLGFAAVAPIRPVFDPREPPFDDLDLQARLADLKVSGRLDAERKGYELGPEYGPTPLELAHLDLRCRVWAAAYGGEVTAADLAAELAGMEPLPPLRVKNWTGDQNPVLHGDQR